MKIGKILKISISAILSLALIASIIVIPAVSAETSTDYNLIQNGSFETGDYLSWMTSTSCFSVVNAAEETVATAKDGDKVLKLVNSDSEDWNNLVQIITIEPDTDYVFSFWYYRVNDGTTNKVNYPAVQAGYANNNWNGFLQVWLNNASKGTWTQYTKTFNSGDYTVFNLSLAAFNGTSYIDAVSLKKVVTITATAETGGTVAGLPTGNILAGDNITLSATANKGYTVDGWYNGDTKVSDSAIYTFTATENADLTAKFTADPALISDGGFEDETRNAAWIDGAGGALTIKTDDKYTGNQSAFIKPAQAWANTRYEFTAKANTYYAVKFMAKRTGSDGVIKVTTRTATGTNILDEPGAGGNKAIGADTTWTPVTATFYSGDTTDFNLYFTGNSTNVGVYIDDLKIVERYTVTATAEENGTVTPESSFVADGDSATLTATPNAGYLFNGWYNGDTLVSTATPYTFTVAGNTALTAKFVADDGQNMVVNGSFEGALVSGWNATTYPDFTSVNAADNGIAAIDGDRVLKVAKAESWNYNFNNQKITVEAGKKYVVSFWAYRPTSSDVMMYKLGTSASDGAYIDNRYLNDGANIATGKWVYIKNIITSTDTILKISLVSYTGTVYLDDIRVVETETIGNLIENGNLENAVKGINAWSSNSQFTYASDVQGYTGTGALKIVGNGTDDWKAITYTLSVKANTDYKIDFWAKNTSASERMIYKVLTTSNASLIGGDKNTNGSGESDGEWGYNYQTFNTGENTTIKIQFVERVGGTTYVDDIYVGERIATDVTSSNEALGTVKASKKYVGEDDEVTYTATATAGGKFLGWRVGSSETLVEGETYTYKGFDDLTLTAVFEAALGNVNQDSAIDATDMAALRNSILGTADYTALGDMNANEANDIRDLVALYKAISK